jgi:MoaA/NifB/PqqE/SkfB family radical SAM enzyme
MCYRDMLSASGQMDPELFRQLVDECQRHGVFSIRLSWRGELLTHPNIREMIAYATARIPNVSFLTNAFYLDDATAECLVESGVAYVAVSFDGVLDVYEAVRAPAKFHESREKVARLKRLREERGASRPQIRLCTVWPAVSRDPEQYQRLMTPVCDYMVCNPYINFKGERRIKPDFICQYPWERIVVGYDGKAQCCTGWEADDIILGQGGRDSIASMWNGPLLEAIRAKHAAGERMSIGSCAECRHGAQGDPDASIQEIVRRKY